MQDLIEKFVTLTDNGLAPERYRRWAALVMIAAILDRRVWTSIRPGMPLFPNLFVLLVAKPGVGKTMAILPARSCVETQSHVGLSPDSITHERFVAMLAERAEVLDPEEEMPTHRATIALMLSEWGTFLRSPDNDDLAMLAQLYDCGDYSAETISRGLDNAESLYVNIIAGCTPAWFAEGFPPNSYEQGLPTRMHFIYSNELATGDQPDFEFSDDPLVVGRTVADKLLQELDPDSVGRADGKFHLLMDCHDSIMGQMRIGDLETARRVRELMRVEVPVHGRTLVIPISVEHGPNWQQCKEYGEGEL